MMRSKVPHTTVLSRHLGGACAYETDPVIRVPSLDWCMARAPRRDNSELFGQVSFGYDLRATVRIGYPGGTPRPPIRQSGGAM